MTPSSSRSAPITSLNEPTTEQRESSQSSAAPLLNASMITENSSSPVTVPIIPCSSSPATVPITLSAVSLINPNLSQAANTNVEDNHQTSGPSSSIEAAFPHAHK